MAQEGKYVYEAYHSRCVKHMWAVHAMTRSYITRSCWHVAQAADADWQHGLPRAAGVRVEHRAHEVAQDILGSIDGTQDANDNSEPSSRPPTTTFALN